MNSWQLLVVFDIVQALYSVIRREDRMRVPKPINFTTGLAAITMAAAILAFASPAPAAEGPNLAPAEYKPLPVGTVINYDKRSYTVTRNEGFEIVVKEGKSGNWNKPYAVFGRQGFNSYTLRVISVWRDWAYDAFFDDKGKSALKSLWPLKVGKKAELEFGEIFNKADGGEGSTRPWNLSLEVQGTESLEIKGIQYPAYVVKVRAFSEKTGIWTIFPVQEYIETHWYNPDSGLVLKFNREWIRGGTPDPRDSYSLVSVSYPKGTTTHALKGAPISVEAQAAKATTLPPAPYKTPAVGTKVKYDDRIYRVTRTDGFQTTYRSVTGDKLSYLNAYALFGEYAESLHVSFPQKSVPYVIESDSRKKLETFWPLEKGKKITYTLVEEATGWSSPEEWNITLEVTGAEVLNIKGTDYAAYVIEEKGRSESGKVYVGRKWYDPKTGLIVKSERTWTKSFPVKTIWNQKIPHFAEGDEDNYTLVKARFPEGAVAVAAKQDKKAPPAVSAAEAVRLKQAAEKARKAEAAEKARARELARLEREAEKARDEAVRQARAQELALLEREAEEKRKAEAARKARTQELARLEREAEENRKAEAARQARAREIARLKREAEAASRAREAETGKATATEMARLKKEAEAVRRVHEAEIADLKREAETIRKARETRETEIARLKQVAEEAEKARLAEVARLKREAGEFQKAQARRNALEAEEDKARKAEIARLKKEAEETRKAQEARDVQIANLRKQLEEVLKAQKLAQAPKESKVAAGLAGIEFGNYHALVIGIDNYKNLPKLKTAINDARGVTKILKDEYGFKVTTLIDPDRLDIIDAFDELQETLTDKDNLLIYYAGHGWLNQDVDRGYWLPVDAKPKRRSRWISNVTITDTLKGLSAKHVMVVADSCYSGTLVRGADVGSRKRGSEYWKDMAKR
jgi:hypothetical protein